MDKYSILHCHTMLSNGTTNVDSVTSYMDYLNRIKESPDEGIANITFTEHGNIFNWYKKKLAIENIGQKYIHAVEAYITEDLGDKIRDNYHCVLFARNFNGVKELNRLVSSSFNRANVKCYGENEQFYYTPRITFDELVHTSENIIISTACMAGILCRGHKDLKAQFLRFIIDNKDRCFLEVQHHKCSEQAEYNAYLAKISHKYGLNLLACTDTHCLNESHSRGRSMLQKAKGISFDNESEWDLVFKTYSELVGSFKTQNALSEEDYMTAIANTNMLVSMVDEFTLDTNTKYPHIYDNPVGTFKKKINEAYKQHPYIKQRYSKAEFSKVVNDELAVYEKTKSIDFMLLQTYMREWERKQGIQCGYGRGSVSGSEIAYTLGITQMDSLKFGLNFFRFMNPSRVTNADIDTDYSGKDREKVKYFLLHDHMNLPQIQSAEIITFNTIALKGAIRDIGRALNISLDEVSKICSMVDDNESGAREKYPELFDYVDIVNGTVVSVGTHPSGVLVTDKNLYEDIGLCTLSSSDYPVSMLNMKELDALMYVKLDILGLDNIGIVNETCKMLGIDRLTPDNVDLEDEAVWKSIRDDTTMIFQWESQSAQAYLRKFMSDKVINIAKKRTKNFSYIKWFSFGNGLIRPGCASFRDDVAKGNALVTGFKELDEFLAVTAGRITMQEDIMQFLVKFCGYSDAESDTVRRGIAKKYGTEQFIDEIHRRFVSYSHEHYCVTIDKLEKIFPPIKQGIIDASDYSFSWNHSDSYSCLGYICGYLRYYHTIQFVTAALNVFQDKEDKTLDITKYANKVGIKFRPIKFGSSRAGYSCNENENCIYKGIASIKYLNDKIADELYEIGQKPYDNFVDVLRAIESTSVNSRQLDVLVKLDFFSAYGEINELLEIIKLYGKIIGKKQFKIDKLIAENLPIDVIAAHCKKRTEKIYKDFDDVELLNAIIDDYRINGKMPETTILDKIGYQQEHYGYIQITIPEMSEQYAYVQNIDGMKKKTVMLYRLKTGDTETVRVREKDFGRNEFKIGDIINTVECSEERRWKRNNETGEFYQIDEYETILKKWNRVEC